MEASLIMRCNSPAVHKEGKRLRFKVVSREDKYWVARKFYDSLMRLERLPSEKIQAYQNSQLQQLLAHAAKEVPFYRQPLNSIRHQNDKFKLDRWQELPMVSRPVIAGNWESFQSENLPQGHKAIIESTTSGSEGVRLKMRKTRFEH